MIDGRFMKVRDAADGAIGFVEVGGDVHFGMLFSWDIAEDTDRGIVDLSATSVGEWVFVQPREVFYRLDGATLATRATAADLSFTDQVRKGTIAFADDDRYFVIQHRHSYLYVSLTTGLIGTSRPDIIGSIKNWTVEQRLGDEVRQVGIDPVSPSE